MSLDTLDRPPAAGTPTGKRHTILVVCEDESAAAALAGSLRGPEFRAVTAGSGLQALRIARSDPPSLVVLETRLADMDGLTFCERLAKSPATRCIPVIVLSAMTRPDIIRRTLGARVAYFVRKPLETETLCALVRRAICESAPLSACGASAIVGPPS